MAYFSILFRGLGQIMLQNNAVSGLLFLLGLFYNSPLMAGAAVLGTVINTLSASLWKVEKKEIENGLHGYNGALIGIAIWTFFEINLLSISAIILGSALVPPVQKLIKKTLPPYTAPFVAITWISILVLRFLFDLLLPSAEEAIADSANILHASANGFGQVMFQENLITGILFLAGILVNSRLSAIYAIYASVSGALIALLFVVPTPSVNAGLMGYNAILCAIALGSEKKNRFLWITLSIIASVLIHLGISKTGTIPLTAPFVIATWIFERIRKESEKRILKAEV